MFDSFLSETKYVGEIGLDGEKGYKEHWDVQGRVFQHIHHSLKGHGGRAMYIHSQSSSSAVLDDLQGCSGILFYTGLLAVKWD